MSLEGSIFIFARSQFDWSIINFLGYIGQFQKKRKEGKLPFCAPSQVVTIPTLGKTSKIKCGGVGCIIAYSITGQEEERKKIKVVSLSFGVIPK